MKVKIYEPHTRKYYIFYAEWLSPKSIRAYNKGFSGTFRFNWTSIIDSLERWNRLDANEEEIKVLFRKIFLYHEDLE